MLSRKPKQAKPTKGCLKSFRPAVARPPAGRGQESGQSLAVSVFHTSPPALELLLCPASKHQGTKGTGRRKPKAIFPRVLAGLKDLRK